MNGRAPFLLIDAGNSRVKWALGDGRGAFLHRGAFAHGRDADSSADSSGDSADSSGRQAPARKDDGVPAAQAAGTMEIAEWAALPAPSGAWISNVAGEAARERLTRLLDAHWPGLPRAFVRARERQCGVVNGYGVPERLGSDRWAGLIGAHAAFPGEALLIATLGTATTLEALTADGRFVGGMIAPGWSLMMRSLGEHTAQLPTLAVDSVRTRVGDALARHWFATDTRHAITAGSLLAQAGLIERAWRELCRAWDVPVRLVVGGGAAGDVAGALGVPHTCHDTLVLSGLALIAAEDAAVAREM
ncbi:type III pantothenate kinase [Trinickia dinghuensis]|uniref:Type III pantothenate kinase n=1 Tax=Trinickia dinghuensis TaxID=2291023 RepID=A0A3D8K521_9BURK|nr:type III pantothenate kinase [Trinickia dinghuensis]RDU99964.1 type III pantothenate kinase [Trinickia dinghuensis]